MSEEVEEQLENESSNEPKGALELTENEPEEVAEEVDALDLNKAPEWQEITLESLREHLPSHVTIQGKKVDFPKMSDEALQPSLQFINQNKVDAKAFLDFQIQQQVASSEAERAAFVARSKEMQEQLNSHPEIGGEHWEGTKTRVLGLLDKYGNREFKEFLARSGGQNYAPVLSFLNKIAKAVPSTGSPAEGQSVKTDQRPLQDRLFG